MKTIAKTAVAAAFATAGVVSFAALAQTGNPGGPINDNLGDRDYGVCRGIDPACYHDWPREKPAQVRVLLFTHTAGPRHANIGTPLKEGLNPELADNNIVQRELGKLLKANNIEMDYTEDLSQMTRLNGYSAVIFYSTSRDNLDDDAKTALRQYMRRGGGFVAVHNAFGTLYNWPYYEGLLGNANYFDHGPNRTGDVVIVDNKDASTKGLPARWKFKDEWYNLIPFPTKVRFLATVDEKSWDPAEDRGGEGGPVAGRGPAAPAAGAQPAAAGAAAGRGGNAAAAAGRGGAPAAGRGPQLPSVVGDMPGHGSFHPVTWCQYYDGGKVWVTTLGHDAGDWTYDGSFPGAKEFQTMLLGGIKSVAGLEPFCQ